MPPGRPLGAIGAADPTWGRPRVSPEGGRVIVGRTVQGNQDLWLLDGARTSRFTFDAATDDISIWSPDGSRIVFTSTRTGGGDLYQKLSSGAGTEERVVASDEVKTPSSWSADGRFVLYHSTDPQTSSDLWVAPIGGGIRADARSRAVRVSQDVRSRGLGRLLARRPLDRVHVERVGAARDLRAALCARPARRLGRSMAGVHRGRDSSRLAARREGAVLHRPGRCARDGADRLQAEPRCSLARPWYGSRPASWVAGSMRVRDGSTTSHPTGGS